MRTPPLLLLLLALPLFLAGSACRHTDPPPPPAGDGLAELVWVFEPGPRDEGFPPTRAALRYDGTGTLDTGSGPRPITLGPIGMSTLIAAIENARPYAGQTFGDPKCEGGCSHDRVEVKATRGAPWTLARHGAAAPDPVSEVFFSLLHGVRPK